MLLIARRVQTLADPLVVILTGSCNPNQPFLFVLGTKISGACEFCDLLPIFCKYGTIHNLETTWDLSTVLKQFVLLFGVTFS